MAIDPAPGWNVVQCARVSAMHHQHVAGRERSRSVLGTDHWQRTQKTRGIERVLAHTYQTRGTWLGDSGTTDSKRSLPSAMTARKLTLSALRP